MLPERKNISLRSLRIPCDLFASADKSISLSLLNSKCPPALPWQLHEDIEPVYFIQLWSTPVSCITSSLLIEKVHLPSQFQKSSSWDSRAWMTNLFSYSQQTPVKQVALPGHFKWLLKRSKNYCWLKYYLKNCMNKFKIELLTVARYKMNYGKTYLSLNPAQIFC